MICQRSIFWSGANPPAFWKNGGGGLSMIQRVTRMRSPSRSVVIGAQSANRIDRGLRSGLGHRDEQLHPRRISSRSLALFARRPSPLRAHMFC